MHYTEASLFSVISLIKRAVLSFILSGLFCLTTVHAQYEGVWFFNQDISGFDFKGMNMEGANFYYATNLDGADFTNANIYGTYFNGTVAKGFTEEMLKSTQTWKDGVVYAVLYDNNLSNWDLSNMDLRGSYLNYYSTNLSGVNLSGSDIRHTTLQGTHTTGLTPGQVYATKSYQEKDLTGVDFSTSELASEDGSVVWNFDGQNLTGADFWASVVTSKDGTQRVSFVNAIVKDANFGASSSWHYGGKTSLQFVQIQETLSYQQKDLGAINLSDNDLRGWDFNGQNLEGASFYNSNVTDVDFTGANIKGANFYWAYDNNTHWSGMEGGLTYEQLISTESYQNKDLGAINLGGTWGGSDYISSALQNVRRDLSGWDLSEQNLEGASFKNANIRTTNFDNAVITGADFSSEFDNLRQNGGYTRNTTDTLSAAQLYKTASYKDKNLQGVIFDSISLAGWDLTDQNLTGASFSASDLTGTDFTGANVQGADFQQTTKYGFTAEQLYSTASYQNGDLSYMDFRANDMTGWDFSNQNLTNVAFYAVTLENADLTGSTILGASFEGTTAKGFTAEQLYSTASYANKDLRGINLRSNTLSGWDLSGQNLQNSSFAYTSLAGVNLTNADMRGAYVAGVSNMDTATIKNTIWSDGVVKNAELAADGDSIVVKNYTPHSNLFYPMDDSFVITTKISDENLVMTGGRLIIETGAPLALVQHKNLTADGGSIVMNYGDMGFGIINVYGGSQFELTLNTDYYIDFGLDEPTLSEYTMVDISYGGEIIGDIEWINYQVMVNGTDVTADWEFAIAGNGNLIIRNTTLFIPEPSSGLLVLTGAALAFVRRRKR